MEYSHNNLIFLLETFITKIKAGEFTEDEKRNIWGSLVWEKNDKKTQEFMKYIFTGWWIHQNLQNKNILCPNNESKSI